MMRSLFSGVSGIKVHQTRMDVIGNNIANINTIGFKGSRTTFSDMLSQLQSAASAATATRGGVNPRQVGLGVNVESIDLIFTDSSPQSTGKNTDLALAGEGLFYLREGNQSYYTRNGSFLFDEGGNYVMAGTGFRVQGWNASSEGEINTNGASTDIVVPIGKTMEATETTSIKYSGNLNKESKMIKSISYTKSNSGDADDSLVVTKSPSYSTAISITVPEGYQLSSGEEAITGTIKGSTQYTVDGDNADVSAEIFAKRVRGARDNERDGEEAYFYNLIYTDADGNELGRVRSTTSYTNTEVPDLPDITANATANSVAEDVTTSVNVDGTNVVSATITFRDGTQQTVTSGYYEVGKSIPITTLATIYDSLGGKHEVTILLDKDPNSTGGDATPVDDDAISSGKTTYVYYDDSHTKQTVTLLNSDSAISSATDDAGNTTMTYTKTYKVTNVGTADSPVYISETGHPLTADEAATVDTETLTYTIGTAGNVISSTPVYDNRWRVYINPGVGEKGPAAGEEFKNSYTRSEATENAEEDGSSTKGEMTFTSYIYFNDKGAYINNGRNENAAITFEYGDGNGASSNQAILNFSDLTQYANSTTSFPTTNGNTAGVLQSVSVDSNGIISGTYTNGLIRNEAQVAVAQFTNSAGLLKVGTTIYQESNNSGTANIRTIADFGLSVTSSALEMSNVDLATEFSEMIITQRGFQANSKMTTVSDEMLETLVNMKR